MSDTARGASGGFLQISRTIDREADVYVCLALVKQMAMDVGMDRLHQGYLGTTVVELATNILKYAGRGTIYLERLRSPREGIQIIARDKGPGISDVEKAMTDAESTGSSLGLGLPGSKRMMDEFEIETDLNVGTTVTARKWTKNQRRLPKLPG